MIPSHCAAVNAHLNAYCGDTLRRDCRRLLGCAGDRPYNTGAVEYKVYLVGHPLARTPIGDAHNEAFRKDGLPIEFVRMDIPPVNFHRELSELLRQPEVLGIKVAKPYKQTALSYCQEISHPAKATGVVNTMVKRRSGLVYGHNTEAPGLVKLMRDGGIDTVRSALILGAGEGARIALAALRDLGCARYLVGYRNPRRPTELSSQFKGIRRQVSYFPLNEMTEFFSWAESSGVLPEPPAATQKSGKKKIKSKKSTSGGDRKRWSVVVNATPIGLGQHQGESLITSASFMTCFEHVIELAPAEEPTPLAKLAQQAGVPVFYGLDLLARQSDDSREAWIKEYNRRERGESAPARRMRIKRRSRG